MAKANMIQILDGLANNTLDKAILRNRFARQRVEKHAAIAALAPRQATRNRAGACRLHLARGTRNNPEWLRETKSLIEA